MEVALTACLLLTAYPLAQAAQRKKASVSTQLAGSTAATSPISWLSLLAVALLRHLLAGWPRLTHCALSGIT